MHRLRQCLPYFRQNGWDPVVFAIDPDRVEGSLDPLLSETVPADVPVHHVDAFSPRLTRLAGLGNLGFRSWFQLRRAVDNYLASNPVDLICFTTTVFTAIAHGPHWQRKFGVPFVVDLQDPWRNDYYLSLPNKERPRKFRFDHWQKSRLEAATMPNAAGVMAVSRQYIDTVQSRYPALKDRPTLALPFAASPGDIEVALQMPVSKPIRPGKISLRYVGARGPDMTTALRILFRAARRGLSEHPDLFERLSLEFIGTSYAAAGRGNETVMPIAREEGVSEIVTEWTDRQPYFGALRLLLDADVLMIIGADSPAYSASKAYGYIMARRPLVAILRKDSNTAALLEATQTGQICSFEELDDLSEPVEVMTRMLVTALLAPSPPTTDWTAFQAHTAAFHTSVIAHFFDQITGNRGDAEAARPAETP
ncbi:MAG: glycosyltransferase [Minwuia sp.]|nr:glycosyltransferase [Minwuia sp.]